MNNLSFFNLCLSSNDGQSSNAQRSDSDNPYIGGGIAILDLVAEDPREYVSAKMLSFLADMYCRIE